MLAGLGMVAKSCRWEIMAAACKKVAFAGDVELAETEAMNFSIKVSVQSGLTPLVIESDAKIVVNLML